LGIPTIADFYGVPREAKTSAIGSALGGTGNQIDQLLGSYINKGVNNGRVLSESGPGSFEGDVRRMSAMLEALTGEKAPNATATGFENNPTWANPPLGKAASKFQLPPGYEFINDPNAVNQAFDAIVKQLKGVGSADSANAAMSGSNGQGIGDWQSVLNQLISQGDLKKYSGPMGAVGGGNTSGSAVPNVVLPHPLQSKSADFLPASYPQ